METKKSGVSAAKPCVPQPPNPLPRMLNPNRLLTLVKVVILMVTAAFFAQQAGAAPYASHLTNNAGTIQFYLNENADNAYVLFDNNTVSNNLGALTRGLQTFALGAHTNYAIGAF